MRAFLCGLMLLSATAWAVGPEIERGKEQLSWLESPGATGYRLYWGTASGNYANVLDVGIPSNNPCTVIDFPDGQIYWTVSAYNDSGESLKATEAAFVVVAPIPQAPTDLQAEQTTDPCVVVR